MAKTNDVIALGNALMDFLVEVEDHHLTSLNLQKGEMHLINEQQAQTILKKINHLPIETLPGGSSANTLKALALLGNNTIFYGKVGHDQNGASYEQQMIAHGVNMKLGRHPSLTGHAITFITSDSERTFATHLGASTTITPETLLEADIQKSTILHLNGYQLEPPIKATALYAMDLAKKHHTLISLDLADPALIKRNLADLKQIAQTYANILFLNEAEAEAFTGLPPEQAIHEIAKYTQIAIVKLGENGSLISHDGIITYINAYPANAIDTTGAGDTFSAGFLHGYLNNWPLEKAGKLGSLMASKIVEQKGVNINNLSPTKLIAELE